MSAENWCDSPSQGWSMVQPGPLWTDCGWCSEHMTDGPKDENGRVSTGICRKCREKALDDIRARKEAK